MSGDREPGAGPHSNEGEGEGGLTRRERREARLQLHRPLGMMSISKGMMGRVGERTVNAGRTDDTLRCNPLSSLGQRTAAPPKSRPSPSPSSLTTAFAEWLASGRAPRHPSPRRHHQACPPFDPARGLARAKTDGWTGAADLCGDRGRFPLPLQHSPRPDTPLRVRAREVTCARQRDRVRRQGPSQASPWAGCLALPAGPGAQTRQPGLGRWGLPAWRPGPTQDPTPRSCPSRGPQSGFPPCTNSPSSSSPRA